MQKRAGSVQSKNGDIHIVQVPIGDLRAAEYNPRRHDDAMEEQLCESITKFGFIDPILVNGAPNRKNVILGGHFRVEVAKKLGYETIPCVYVSIPDLNKEKEINLRLNKNTGEFDIDLLKNLDIELLLNVGFDDADLNGIWGDALSTEDDGFDAEKAVSEIKVPKTKLGDLYSLGGHRLLCGDSTDLASVQRLVGKELVPMFYCDPPYNIGLDYNKGVSTSGKYGGFKTNDSKTLDDYRLFLKVTVQNALAVSLPDTHAFYWCDETYIGMVQSIFSELGLTNRRVCLWLKDNFNMTPGVAFNKVAEPCVYATRGKPFLAPGITNLNEIMNKEIATGNRMIDDILDLLNIWLVKRLPAQEYEHPTAKNPKLHEKAIRRCTKVGDVILDLFGGSGSLLVAAEQLKRRAFLCEQEPIFCDVIIKRYEELTGNKAKLIG